MRCLASGYDFGDLSDPAVSRYFPVLSDCERYALSWVRPYGHVIKVSAPGDRTSNDELLRCMLRAHFISYLQSGPQEVVQMLGVVEQLERLYETVRVAFVGPTGSRDALAERFRKMKETKLRPWVMYNYVELAYLVSEVRSECNDIMWPMPARAPKADLEVACEAASGPGRS